MRRVLALLLGLLLAAPAAAQQLIVTGTGAGGGGITPNDALWLSTPTGTVTVASPVTISGGYSGADPPNVYLSDSGAAAADCSATIGAGIWSCTFVPTAGGARYLRASNTADTRAATSNIFTITGGAFAGPLDAYNTSTSACYMLLGCSAAIASGGTTVATTLFNPSAGSGEHCDFKIVSTGQVGTSSNCGGGSDNGDSISAYCALGAGACYWYTGAPATFKDQTGARTGFSGGAGVAPQVTTSCGSLIAGRACGFFDGTFNMPGDFQDALLGSGSFGVFVWVRPTELNVGVTYSLLSGSNGGGLQLRVIGLSGGLTGRLQAAVQGTASIGTSTACVLTKNAWNGIGFTYNQSTGDYAFYVGSGQCAAGTDLHSLTLASDVMNFGAAGGDTAYKGNLTGLVFYKSLPDSTHSIAVLASGP